VSTLTYQHRSAAVSADVRSRRSELKAKLKRGEERLERMIAIPPWWLLGARVDRLLVAVPGISATGADRLLLAAEVWGFATFGSLTREQRRRLIGELGAVEARR
jgi:hypothetical protein